MAPAANTHHGPLKTLALAVSLPPALQTSFLTTVLKNGILPIKLPQADVDKLMDDAKRGANARLTIDLENQTIKGPDGGSIAFEVDPFRKHCLLQGLDDIGLTMQKQENIESFEEKLAEQRPWV